MASKEQSRMRSESVFDKEIPVYSVPCIPMSVSVIFWLFHGLLLWHRFVKIFYFTKFFMSVVIEKTSFDTTCAWKRRLIQQYSLKNFNIYSHVINWFMTTPTSTSSPEALMVGPSQLQYRQIRTQSTPSCFWLVYVLSQLAFTPLIEKMASKERSQTRSECVLDNEIVLHVWNFNQSLHV